MTDKYGGKITEYILYKNLANATGVIPAKTQSR